MDRVGLLVFDGVDLLDVGGPYEVLLTANRLSVRRGDAEPFEVLTVSATGEPVTAYGGLVLVPQHGVDTTPQLDVVLVPGLVDVERLLADDGVRAAIRRLAAEARLVTSVCTGAFLLAGAGLVAGRPVTTHHEDVEPLQSMLTDSSVRTARWVDAGNLVTAGGLSSGIAMALHLVERATTRALAVATAEQLEYAWDPDDGVIEARTD